MKFEIEVNGLHIVVGSNSQQSFTLIDNCTKLSPIGFVSGADQKFLGIDIYKGNIIRSHPTGPSDYEIVFGEIDDDGYHKVLTIDPDLTIENTLKNLADFQMAKKIFENGPTCISVAKDRSNNEGFNVYAGKKYDFNVSQPTFWQANSKYVGNVLCSDQPKAVIDCSGAELLIQHFIEISLGLNKEARLEERKGDPVEQERYRKELEEAVVTGKKCDEAIAKHEKETGKKIKLSPVYTEHFLKMKSSF